MLKKKLRRGWTTGACATAASKAAYIGLLTGICPDKITITLPNGQSPTFTIAYQDVNHQSVSAGIIKDAGDDPDVTNGILIISKVETCHENNGVKFFAGNGVGTVTLPGLPLDVGEPAINPGPRKMIIDTLQEVAIQNSVKLEVNITIEVPEGYEIAKKTWNTRLGIQNGISILGTTGIVIPFSCAAWIHSIHRGVDVAKKTNLLHIAACTGSISEKVTQNYFELPDQAMIDMGDFVGGLLKYLKKNTVPRITIAGGFAKLVKLSQGSMDLHSSRSQVDLLSLIEHIKELKIDGEKFKDIKRITTANQCLEILGDIKYDLSLNIAKMAQDQILNMLKQTQIGIDVMIIDRKEEILAQTDIRYA